MHVVNADPVLDRLKSELIRGAVGDSALHAPAREQHGEPVWVVVATIARLRDWHSAKFAAPDDQGLLEKTATLQIPDQSRRGPDPCPDTASARRR